MIPLNRHPSRRDLTVFAATGLAFTALACLLAWRRELPAAALIIGSVGAVTFGGGLAAPRALRLVYLGAMYATFPIGFVMSYLVLGIVYFLVLTPIGWVMRLCGRDPLTRRFEPTASTYWVAREKSKSPSTYFRPH